MSLLTRIPTQLLLAAATAFALPAGSALAQGKGSTLGFGVTPENSPRGHLELEAKPGETVRGALQLTNTRDKPVTVALRIQDARSAATGGLDYEEPAPGGVGAWLELSDRRVELPARRTVRVAVTARVPDDARPGDHFAGVVAYNATELARVEREQAGRTTQLRFISRFGVAVQFRLPGDASAGMSAEDATIETTPSGAAIVIPLRNDGQLLIPSAKGQVTVKRDGRELFTEHVQIGAFIPGGRISHPVRFRQAPVEGTYQVSGFIHPSEGEAVTIDDEVTFGREQTRALADRSGQEAVRDDSRPLLLVVAAAVLALIGLVLLAVVLRQRSSARPRRGRAPARDLPPAATGAPPRHPHPAATLVDLNCAGPDQLQRLPGIGEAAAARIIEHRREYGDFETLDELANVPGFDAERVARLAGRAMVGSGR